MGQESNYYTNNFHFFNLEAYHFPKLSSSIDYLKISKIKSHLSVDLGNDLEGQEKPRYLHLSYKSSDCINVLRPSSLIVILECFYSIPTKGITLEFLDYMLILFNVFLSRLL